MTNHADYVLRICNYIILEVMGDIGHESVSVKALYAPLLTSLKTHGDLKNKWDKYRGHLHN